MSKYTRIARFHDPARGGRRVERLTFVRHTIVLQPGGICEETTRETWQDIGTLMPPITNHTPQQPKCYAQKLIEANQAAQRGEQNDDRI